MELLEKDLEQLVCAAAQTQEGLNFLNHRGLSIAGKLWSQVNLGSYGIADIITAKYEYRTNWDAVNGEPLAKPKKVFKISIYELKKDELTTDALGQVCRYKKGLEETILNRYPSDKYTFNIEINLIGSDVNVSNDMPYLLNEMRQINIYQYQYDYDGLHFNRIAGKGWRKTSPGEAQAVRFSRAMLKDMAAGWLATKDFWIAMEDAEGEEGQTEEDTGTEEPTHTD